LPQPGRRKPEATCTHSALMSAERTTAREVTLGPRKAHAARSRPGCHRDLHTRELAQSFAGFRVCTYKP
jgi:hypothetical protein